MNEQLKKELSVHATNIRLGALEGIYNAGSGHPGGSLSVADILTYLYFVQMNVDPADPKMECRDRFVLSKGHAAPALYATLAEKGYFSKSLLKTLRNKESMLQGHPDMKKIPGVDITTGSLGLGISAACGMAKAAKMYSDSYKVYAIVGDGESEEGQVWEAAMFAGHYKLNNLCVFIDFNGLQIDGDITEVMNPTPFDKKFEAFGWDTVIIDGNNFDDIESALSKFGTTDKPLAIIAKCVKGKGVSFMENAAEWHGNAPKKEQYEQAVAELEALLK